MKDEDRLREQLRTVYELRYKAIGKGLGELAQNIEVSKSYISLFLTGALKEPSPKLLLRIKRFLKVSELSQGDQRLLMDLLRTIDNADDAANLLAALVLQRGRDR